MIGPILVFLAVCAVVAIYMAIIRSFLNKSEHEVTDLPPPAKDSAGEQKHNSTTSTTTFAPPNSRDPQWAH